MRYIEFDAAPFPISSLLLGSISPIAEQRSKCSSSSGVSCPTRTRLPALYRAHDRLTVRHLLPLPSHVHVHVRPTTSLTPSVHILNTIYALSVLTGHPQALGWRRIWIVSPFPRSDLLILHAPDVYCSQFSFFRGVGWPSKSSSRSSFG